MQENNAGKKTGRKCEEGRQELLTPAFKEGQFN